MIKASITWPGNLMDPAVTWDHMAEDDNEPAIIHSMLYSVNPYLSTAEDNASYAVYCVKTDMWHKLIGIIDNY